jgi:branched-chain amino acid transport system ATP-binding protein
MIGTAALVAIGLFAYRLNRARKMVSQYPWLYERAGLFRWRDRHQP